MKIHEGVVNAAAFRTFLNQTTFKPPPGVQLGIQLPSW